MPPYPRAFLPPQKLAMTCCLTDCGDDEAGLLHRDPLRRDHGGQVHVGNVQREEAQDVRKAA